MTCRKWRDRGVKASTASLACPKWPNHYVLARGNRSFAARVSRVAACGLVEDKPLARENRSRPGFLARVIFEYNCTLRCIRKGYLALYKFICDPRAYVHPARARSASVRPRRRIPRDVPRDCKARTDEEHCSPRGEPGWTGKSLKTFLYVTVASCQRFDCWYLIVPARRQQVAYSERYGELRTLTTTH